MKYGGGRGGLQEENALILFPFYMKVKEVLDEMVLDVEQVTIPSALSTKKKSSVMRLRTPYRCLVPYPQ
jgi:hypothetical protein